MELEELETIDEELETVARQQGAPVDFPAITIMGKQMYINVPFSQLIPNVKYIEFRVSSSYVIMLPQDHASSTAYKVSTCTKGYGKAVYIPAPLKEKRIKRGVYKVYKYKEGWAIKRYEPVEVFK